MSVTRYADAPTRGSNCETRTPRSQPPRSSGLLGLLSWLNRVDLAARYPDWAGPGLEGDARPSPTNAQSDPCNDR